MLGEPRLAVNVTVSGERGDRPRLEARLQIPAGITVVTGPSGAGKSTLLAAIAGLSRPQAGRIELDGNVLFDAGRLHWVPPHRRRVALVFQSLALFPHLSVWRNVAYGLPCPKQGRARERAASWLDRTRASHLAERAPGTLSGGEAQRVALARALASEPRALLLDEPFSAMDSELRRELGADLVALVDELAIPALLVTHDVRDGTAPGSRVLELESGRLRGMDLA